MSSTNTPSLFSPRRVQTDPDQDTSFSPSPERANKFMQPSSLLPSFHSPPSKMISAKNRKMLFTSVLEPKKNISMAWASSILQDVAKNPKSWKRNSYKSKEAEREQARSLDRSQNSMGVFESKGEETKSKMRFMSPLSLPDKSSPINVGKYLIRMFDGQLCQTKEERENCILNPIKSSSPKRREKAPQFTKSQNQFNQTLHQEKDVNPVTQDPRDSRRISCRAPMPKSLLSFDIKRITDLKKFISESGLASPGNFMKSKLSRSQPIRQTPQIDDSLSELSARGKGSVVTQDWRDQSKLIIENASSMRSLGNQKKMSSRAPQTPHSFKVPHSRIPYFPRNKVLPPSRQSRSHSPVLFDHPQSSKQRLGIVGQSLNTLRGLRRQISPTHHKRTLDVALQTQVFDNIEKLVMKSLSSDSEHQEEVQSTAEKELTHQISQIDFEDQGFHRRVATEPEEDTSSQMCILPRVTVKPLSQFTPDMAELRKVVAPKQILNTSRLIALTRRTNLKLKDYELQKMLEGSERPGTTNTSRSFNGYFRNLRMFSSTKSESPHSASTSFTNSSTPTSKREGNQRINKRLIPSLFSSKQQSPRLMVKQLASRVPPPQFGLFPYEQIQNN